MSDEDLIQDVPVAETAPVEALAVTEEPSAEIPGDAIALLKEIASSPKEVWEEGYVIRLSHGLMGKIYALFTPGSESA